MRVLGIDPGLRRCGWGVIDSDGTRLRGVDFGTVTPPTDEAMSVRLSVLFEELQAVVARFAPDLAAIEDTFVNANPMSALKLGHARAAALLAPARAGIAVHEFAPSVVKKAVTGSGRAGKDQVAAMVGVLIPGVKAKADAADALAVAVCAAHHVPSPLHRNKALAR